MWGFLWCQGDMQKGRAKVAWETLCMPKREGGLGIRNLQVFNMALMTTHIWHIFCNKESLWVKWVHSYKLKGRSFWDVAPRAGLSWGWRKILQIREVIRPFIWYQLGNGRSVSVWFDTWNQFCPLNKRIPIREINNAESNTSDRVYDLVQQGTWRWPLSWYHRYPALNQLQPLNLSPHIDDRLVWRTTTGALVEFSVCGVWEAIRDRRPEVGWYNTVWFAHCIPRHAFLMWLIMLKSLKTQDRMRQWDIGRNMDLNSLRCPLCNNQPDSHNHLFFECDFSAKVWRMISPLAEMQDVNPIWEEVIAWIQPMAHKRSAKSVISRLVVAATAYFLWKEGNTPLFQKVRTSPENVRDIIMTTVRLKLMTFKFKQHVQVTRLLAKWKMPKNFRTYGEL